ncbi:alpha/beta fold hydrolase [Corynebacterium rhinophilum]|uniref:alpha/beta fold hydrolase n=1 Tax=Corynebacterium rhinophilum TaxID=3050197 RepID=UPI00254BE7B9|nr:alpha/beta fold hydrolase [Corynebacterium sp. MSK189]MDK8673786.1 alpha/beta fold hydrolase [Corynebacterium sp. MSK189]
MTSNATDQPHVILVPGYWLGAWAWDGVVPALKNQGFQVKAVTPSGLDEQDPDRTNTTLQDQVDALQSLVEQAGGDVVLVGHSGANAAVSIVADRAPQLLRRVIWVDSGPMQDGGAFAPELPQDVEELPLPDFDTLGQQASLEGLSDDQLKTFRTRAVPEPAGVARAMVSLTNDRRHGVPTTLICCSLSSSQLLELAQARHPMFVAVNDLIDVQMIDLPTGHWPMWSRPEELANTIATAALSS